MYSINFSEKAGDQADNKTLFSSRRISVMGPFLQRITRLSGLLLITVLIFLPAISVAGEWDTVAWNTILPEDSNLYAQQEKTIKALEVTLEEIDSVINENLAAGKITETTDFTLNKDVALVYDYLMYRIYELIKLDRRIMSEFVAKERVLKEHSFSNELVMRHNRIKTDYQHKKDMFFASMYNLKRAVLIKDLKQEIARVRNSMDVLRSAMNVYSSYQIVTAAR